MDSVTCASCGGSGKSRRGTVVAPIDPFYDIAQHGSINPEWARRGLALLLLVEPGDILEYSGQFSHEVISVGMYDGWPFWTPTPAALTYGPLGVGDWHFYYDITGVKKQGTSLWIRKPLGDRQEAETAP